MSVPRIYHILGVRIYIELDDERLLGRFEQDYAYFRETSPAASDHSDRIRVCSSAGEGPGISIDGVHHSLAQHPNPGGHSYKLLLAELFRRLTGFTLLHAAVAVKDGRAVIISGPAGIGKTTLLLRLVADGFLFFSDDICPIKRDSRLVFPFPRAVRTGQPGAKRTVAARDFLEGRVLAPCPPRTVIFLAPSERDTSDEVTIAIHPKSEDASALIEELRRIGAKCSRSEDDPTEFIVRYRRDDRLSTQVRGSIDKYKDGIWSTRRVETRRPSFSGLPDVIPIEPGELALRLIGELKREFVVSDAEHSVGQLLFDLTGLFVDVDRYLVKTGQIDRLVEEVKRIAKA